MYDSLALNLAAITLLLVTCLNGFVVFPDLAALYLSSRRWNTPLLIVSPNLGIVGRGTPPLGKQDHQDGYREEFRGSNKVLHFSPAWIPVCPLCR